MAKKKGLLATLFGGASKSRSKSRAKSKSRSAASKARAPKSKTSTKKPSAKPTAKKGSGTSKSSSSKVRSSSSRDEAKTLSKKSTGNNNKKKEFKLIPVLIKKHHDKNGGHNHIILEDIDDNHVSVGLTTHKKKGKNATNYHCNVDPLGTGNESYMRRQGQVAPIVGYYEPKQGAMEETDYKQAKVYGERAKQKYLDKKAQKK